MPEPILPGPAPAMAARQDITDMIRFSLEKGWLGANFAFPAELRKPDVTYCRVRGSTALWTVHTTSETPDGTAEEPIIALSYRDAGSEESPGHTQASVYAGGDYLAVSALLRDDKRTVCVIYRSHQDYESVQMEVYTRGDGESRETLINENADSLQQLYDQHGEEVDRYLMPVLKKVTRRNLLGPAAADVYDVFPSLQPDPAVVQQLRRLLPLMDDPQVHVREKASAELAKLGAPGVLAAMRCDVKVLSPEQSTRLSAFIDFHRQRINPEWARRDPQFLIQCLEHDDPAVRAAAKQSAEALLGCAIEFNPDGDFDTRAMEVARVRKLIREQTAAAAR